MHRLCALLLTAVFSFPLIPLSVFEESDSQLPACCRKDGKHACGMRKPGAAPSKGPAISAVKLACPLFPSGKSAPATPQSLLATPGVSLAAPLAPAGIVRAKRERHSPTSVGHSVPTRGPPAFVQA